MMKSIKKFLLLFFIIFCFGFTFGLSEDFLSRMQSLDINIDNFSQQNSVSRLDMIRILNLIDCNSCDFPVQEISSKYTQTWLDAFKSKPTTLADDVLVSSQGYQCLAYSLDKGYINGYPRNSLICPGRVCATNSVNYQDFVDTAYQILPMILLGDYQTDWQKISARTDKDTALSIDEQQTLAGALAKCQQSCNIDTKSEFDVYIKYCSENMGECDFDDLSKGRDKFFYTKAYVLYKKGVISYDDLISVRPGDLLSSSKFLDYADKLVTKNPCKVDLDYDKDGVSNKLDNCKYDYNPTQKDTDNDSKGDVCDDDIDGDSLTNCLAYDDAGNLNIKKFKSECNKDSCPFVSGANCTNTYGDGFYIKADVLGGIMPLNVKFQAIGGSDDISWDFGDGTLTSGKEVSHVYFISGKYIVLAKKKIGSNTYIAKLTLVVGDDMSSYVGFQTRIDYLANKVPFKTTMSADTTGGVSTIEWQIGSSTKKLGYDQNFVKVFTQHGLYTVIAKAYDSKGNGVGYSQFNIGANSADNIYTYPASRLQASKLTLKQGDSVVLRTLVKGFGASNISSIEWDFGDKTTSKSKDLMLTKKYVDQGKKLVYQKIYLKDGNVLENALTLDVMPAKSFEKPGVSLSMDKTNVGVGGSVSANITLNNISKDEIKYMVMDFGDGYVVSNDINTSYSHKYYRSGVYRLKTNIYLKAGDTFVGEASVVVNGQDVCLNIGSLRCDINKDKIPDLCDDDIDGDGIPNLLGLVKYENSDCGISTNVDKNILQNEQLQASKGAKIDNCPWVSNPDQSDTNGNGIGDACDNDKSTCLDQDGDGICDTEDICPTIPENYNGLEDMDGCPEVDEMSDIQNSYVQATACNKCPCQCADYQSKVVGSDAVRAVLCSADGVPYAASYPSIVNDVINQKLLNE